MMSSIKTMPRAPSKCVDPAQQPLQMSVCTSRLKLRLHVSRKIRFRPHETSFKVLYSHHSLVCVQTFKATRDEYILVLQISKTDYNGFIWLALEAQLTVPCHVLNGKDGAVGEKIEIECAIRAEAC